MTQIIINGNPMPLIIQNNNAAPLVIRPLYGPGAPGPQGLSGIHVGTTPPEDTSVLWYDTNIN
jgi:hypothetical protein